MFFQTSYSLGQDTIDSLFYVLYRSLVSRKRKASKEIVDFHDRKDIWIEFKNIDPNFTPLLQLPLKMTNLKIERKISANAGLGLSPTLILFSFTSRLKAVINYSVRPFLVAYSINGRDIKSHKDLARNCLVQKLLVS